MLTSKLKSQRLNTSKTLVQHLNHVMDHKALQSMNRS